jgi:curved DNA-binding protein CbpA
LINYLKVLNIDSRADLATVKSAYRRRIREVHPDNGGNTTDCLRVIKAYKVLSDPDLRRRWIARYRATYEGNPLLDVCDVCFCITARESISCLCGIVKPKRQFTLPDEVNERIAGFLIRVFGGLGDAFSDSAISAADRWIKFVHKTMKIDDKR